MHYEIKIRLNEANRYYFSMKEIFFSKLLSRRTKKHLYYMYLRPIIMYTCDTWFSTQEDEKRLQSFERKILKKIYGPVYYNSLESFQRTNENLQQLYSKSNQQHFLVRKTGMD